MDIEYRRDMNHNYMIVKEMGTDVPDDYETRVISTNRIPGLLTCSMQYIDAEIWYSYDVTSLQKLTVFCESRKIGKSEIVKILSEILRILEGLEDYLLDFRHLVLLPSCVCIDFDTMEIRLMYVPFYCRDIRKSLRELTEYLLGCADHSDQSAIVLGYRFCHEVQENNTQLGDLMGVLYGRERSEAQMQPDDMAYAEADMKMRQLREEPYFGEAGGVLLGECADDLEDPDEWRIGGEPEALSRGGSEKRKPGKSSRLSPPGKAAAIAVVTGLLILAALFVFLHTDLLRYISIYTLCGIGAGICAVILFVHLVRERHGIGKEAGERRAGEREAVEQRVSGREAVEQRVSGKDMREEQREHMEHREAHDAIPVLSDVAEGNPGKADQRVDPEQDFNSDLPVTQLLSSYRPTRGPEDRWLLPASEGRPKKHLAGDDILIGKNQQYADMIIDSPAVSRIHARLRFKAGRYFIGDLSSRNGTTVNGEAVCGEEERVLSEGDVITFADVSYIFSADENGADCESRGAGV